MTKFIFYNTIISNTSVNLIPALTTYEVVLISHFFTVLGDVYLPTYM